MEDLGSKASTVQPAGSKVEMVADVLRNMVLENRFEPGSPIRERALASELEVSRTPLREAIKILEAEGLLVVNSRRGAVVAEPGEEEVRDLLELLGGLEAFAGRLACGRITQEKLREMQALHHEMIAAHWRGDRIGYFNLNQKIHAILVQSSGNKSLEGQYQRTNARLYRVRYEANLRTNRWEDAIKEHAEILKALEARDTSRLSEILENHVLKAYDLLQSTLAEEESSGE